MMWWIWLFACTPPDTSVPTLAAVIDDVVLIETTAFQTEAAAALAATATACTDLNEESLAAAQPAWWSSREPWKRLEVANFGPAKELPYRIRPKVDLWPARTGAIEHLLADDTPLTAQTIGELGGAVRGLPTLEYLLYAPSELAEFTPRRCEFAAAVAGDLVQLADQWHTAWADDWRARLVTPRTLDDDGYLTEQDVLDEWVNRIAFVVEDLRADRLGKPIGDSSGGEPLPDTIESRLSGRSLQDSRDILDGNRAVFNTLVAPIIDAELATQTDQLFAEAAVALEQIPETLETSVNNNPQSIMAAQDALLALQVILQADVAQATATTVAFNDNDGD